MWAALRESFPAEELSRVETGTCGIPGKAALGRQNGRVNRLSGREKACVADHARGVNWPRRLVKRFEWHHPPKHGSWLAAS
jgi:hypothetical protein